MNRMFGVDDAICRLVSRNLSVATLRPPLSTSTTPWRRRNSALPARHIGGSRSGALYEVAGWEVAGLGQRREPSMHDIVIRGGTIIDGTGRPAFTGDVAVDGDRLAAVAGKAGPGRRVIDADGLLVTPGWVDVHTHYDGQATWDPITRRPGPALPPTA